MKIVIKKIHCVDPQNDLDEVHDVLIHNKSIVKIGKNIIADSEKVIDGAGLHLFPGLVDLHVHFRDPGFEYKETIESGIRAALRGGFVACVPMPNTQPTSDDARIIKAILEKAHAERFTLFPCGAITKGREGKELTEMVELKEAGCVAVSDDGSSIGDALLLRHAMEYARMVGLVVMIHPEDVQLRKHGVMHEGLVSVRLGLRGIPSAAEDTIIARDIEIARLTGAQIHFQHISTRRGVELIRDAKKDGLAVTAEVTPHHIALCDEDITTYNTNLKMNPPLRTSSDRAALIAGLKDGVIDVIATDHAPHQQREKDVEFDRAPFGTIGLETALPVALTYLYHTKVLNLAEIVEKMSLRPQEIIGKKRFAQIKEGASANLCIVDCNREWTIDKSAFSSKSHNSCFLGKEVKGKVLGTITGGAYHSFNE